MRHLRLLALLFTTYLVTTPGIAQERIVLQATEVSSTERANDSLYQFPLNEYAYWQPNESTRLQYLVDCERGVFSPGFNPFGLMNEYVRRCNSFFYIATENRFARFFDQPQPWTIDQLEITPRQMSFGVYSGTAIGSASAAEHEAFTVLLNAEQAEITHQGVTYILEDYARFASRHLQNQYNEVDPDIASLNAEVAFWRWALPVIGILGLIALWWVIRWIMRTLKNAVRTKQHEQRKQRQLDAVQTAALKEQARLDVRERHTQGNPGTSRADSLRSQIQLALENNDVETAKILLNELDKIEDKKPSQSGG